MIPTAIAEFLQEGLSIHVATRDDRLVPVGARALALMVDADRRRLTVFVTGVVARRLGAALDVSRQAAVNVGRPSDDRACQVKGVLDGELRAVRPDEAPLVARQWAGFLEQLALVGIDPVTTTAWPTSPVIAIPLRVTAVFEQTPGPQAGVALVEQPS